MLSNIVVESRTVPSVETVSTSDTVNDLLWEAIKNNASDIHIESLLEEYRVRFRIDGQLVYYQSMNMTIANRLIAQIKVCAEMDVAEKRLPQEGYLPYYVNNNLINCRVSTLPTVLGEKMVVRLLPSPDQLLILEKLGMSVSQLSLLKKTLRSYQGLVLATGPTGVGKSTTIYSILQYLNDSKKNIITIEDPVEIKINSINQIAVKRKLGLDFSTILRYILRQDPDIIMVGEIRDKETARMACHAAQTGHLVLSTIHAKTAQDVLPRLYALGVEKLLVKNSLSLIISQALTKLMCEYCDGIKSCQFCIDGFKGRTGQFELLAC